MLFAKYESVIVVSPELTTTPTNKSPALPLRMTIFFRLLVMLALFTLSTPFKL